MKGVDVSYANGKLDWLDWGILKDAGIEFAMCRCTYGKSGIDDTFQSNVNEATKSGIKCGAYHYSYALNEYDAIKEAQHCKEVIDNSGVLLELPVFFDMEDEDRYKKRNGFNFTRYNITNICKSFLDNFPYNKGVYASASWLDSYIDWKSLNCPVWNAEWGNRPMSFANTNGNNDSIRAYIWQFTDRLLIDGREFDGNILYDNRDKAGQHGY